MKQLSANEIIEMYTADRKNRQDDKTAKYK